MAVSDALQYGAHHSRVSIIRSHPPITAARSVVRAGGYFVSVSVCVPEGAVMLLLFTRGVVVVVDGWAGEISSSFFTIYRLDLGQTIPKFRLQATSVAREPDRMFTSNLGN